MRYVLTATALGAGRGRSAVSTWREIFVILQVNSDGGPTPLDIQYHDVHEALGPLSVSLTSASLTVGGTANLSLYHPDPPPGLSVHVARVFLEQTVELYSEVKKAWTKLPTEKLRVWERGYMPYKDRTKQADPNATPDDALWLRNDDDELHGPGRPGRGSLNVHGAVSPFALSSTPRSAPTTPGGSEMNQSQQPLLQQAQSQTQAQPQQQQHGYKIKSVVRLPDDNTIRPSTVRGSRAEVRVSHEVGVEIFFSRASVLDERENSDSVGKPKVQVFSMRRATVIPSCLCTFDTIHLPPYSLESPANSRPPSPTFDGSGFGAASSKARGPPGKNATQSEIDHWRLTQTLQAALPHASGSQAHPGSGHLSSGDNSAARSRAGSRDPSPTRHGSSHHHHHSFGWPGRKSRNSSPTRQPAEAGSGSGSGSGSGNGTGTGTGTGSGAGGTAASSTATHSEPSSRRGSRANIASSLHALTPAHPNSSSASSSHHQPMPTPPVLQRSSSSYQLSSSNAFPTVVTAPASGASTPRSLPANSPWAMTNMPPRTPTSHDTCQCGRTTAELVEAESRLLEGAPTAPGAWIDAHDEGQLPPPWTPSRPSSPTTNSNGDDVVWSTNGAGHHHTLKHAAGAGSAKIGEMMEM